MRNNYTKYESNNDKNTEIMICDNVNDVADELFESLLSRYQTGLKTSMRGSNFIFDSVQLLHWKCRKINFKHVGPCIESPDRIKK